MRAWLALLAGLAIGGAGGAGAATIEVGPGRSVESPAAGVAAAADGDVVLIDAGEYYECLRLRTDGVTVAGRGAGAVFTDTTCDGKAIIVASADRIVLRNLTLQRARVGDGNGAGVRAEGRRLEIENVRFLNDQAGLISTGRADAEIVISDSVFEGAGRCEGGRCGTAINAGAIRWLRVERSRIGGTVGGHAVVSAAASTQIVGSTIEDGAQGGASFQLVIAGGGIVLVEDCTIQKGPRAANLRAAILLDGDIGGTVTLRRNRYLNETGRAVPFVLDWSNATPRLEGNTVAKGDAEISSDGVMAHRAVSLAREAKDAARAAAGAAKRGAAEIYHRLRGN